MTLEEFLTHPKRNAWTTFEHCAVYVRASRQTLGGAVRPTFELANISSPPEYHHTGQFKRCLQLIARTLYDQYGPDHVLFIENVHNPDLSRWLDSQGWFVEDSYGSTRSYWLPCLQVLEIFDLTP